MIHRIKGMSKCAGYECLMVVLGTNHHVVVLCQLSSQKLHPGQQLIDSNKRSAMPVGRFVDRACLSRRIDTSTSTTERTAILIT